ncbi:hypothetical protein [Lentibacillus salinarum]|uniref:Ig-like domain-containing protein n=1 Tax=Lentibacillus salinarum TaxID=446820 RepID=A0ABW3ZWI3_9BACI
MRRKVLLLFLILVVLISPISEAPIKAIDEKMNISVTELPKIDVALTVGNTDIEVEDFEEDLKSELEAKGVDPGRVNIQAFDTTSFSTNDADADVIFNEWENYPNDVGKWQLTTIDGIPVIRSTVNTQWTGFWEEDDASHIEIDSELSVTTSGDNDWVGIAFRMNRHEPNDPQNPYNGDYDAYDMYFFGIDGGGSGESALFKMENAPFKNNKVGEHRMWNVNHNKGNGNLTAYFTQSNSDTPIQHEGKPTNDAKGKIVSLQTTNTSGLRWKRHDFQDIEIKAVENHIEIWVDGKKEIDYIDDENPILTGGYGPYAASQSHATHRNFSVTTKETRAFSEVIRQPEWRDGSERFIVNMEDEIVSDFDDSQALGEILTRLTNEQIDYIGVGSNTNEEQAKRFISRNNDNGVFINSSRDYNEIIEEIADYILSKIEVEQGTSSKYVLVGKPLALEVNPSKYQRNTENSAYPDGRWRVDHDYTYFDNNNGKYENTGVYQSDFDFTFDKVGRYELWFEDRHPEPQYIYAHRQPIASYSTEVQDMEDEYSVSIEDMSYDLDLQSNEDNGIAEHEWKWKETTATTWNEGKVPSSLPAGKDYVVQLRVKDHQGTWSEPEARYITTSDVVAQPIANFDMPPTSLIYNPVDVNNTSYDPAGRNITEAEWTVTRNGVEIYQGSEPITDFNPYGEGKYIVSLRVKNDANIWSEEFSRVINISVDDIAPEIKADIEEQDWTRNNVRINANFADEGGSDFNSQRYVVTKSQSPPTKGWSSWDSNTSRRINLTDEGEYFVHFEAKDNQGNVSQKTVGPYKIDKTPPELKINRDLSEITHEDIELTVEATDSMSGVKQIQTPDNQWKSIDHLIYTVRENGTYKFIAEDKAGNRTAQSVSIKQFSEVDVKHIPEWQGKRERLGLDDNTYLAGEPFLLWAKVGINVTNVKVKSPFSFGDQTIELKEKQDRVWTHTLYDKQLATLQPGESYTFTFLLETREGETRKIQRTIQIKGKASVNIQLTQ